jgi:hypothetical protein
VLGVVPLEVLDRPVARVGRVLELLLDPQRQVVHEPQLRARVARRVERLVAPLHEPLGLREGALLLQVRGGGHEEHLGLDVLRAELAVLDLRHVLPERRRLDLGELADDEPLELGQRAAVQPGVGEPTPGSGP